MLDFLSLYGIISQKSIRREKGKVGKWNGLLLIRKKFTNDAGHSNQKVE